MKRVLKYLALSALAVVSASCLNREELSFRHEEQAFQTQADKILVEVIMPQASTSTDEIYIVGEFNGGEAAIGNPAYLMVQSQTITSKWGVYVDPAQYVGGKTLADGFTFYSVQQGYERSSKNEPVVHKLTIGPGEWANVYADKWEKYFQPVNPDEGKVELPDLEGFGLFVDVSDSPIYSAALALYAWGDAEAFGSWPGMEPTGTWQYEGTTFVYFDLGADATDLTLNFILNNNNGGSQLENFDILKGQVVNHHFFFKATDESIETVNVDLDGGGPVYPEMDGFGLFVDAADSPIYSAAMALYAWGDAEAFGSWPGMEPTGTWEYDGVTYTYFDLGADATGLTLNFIINNNNGGSQLENFDILKGQVVDHNFVFKVTDDGIVAVNLDGDTPTPPAPPAPVYDGPKIYIQDNTTWGGNLFAHYWIDGANTEWPGQQFEETETVEGVEFKVISTLDKMKGKKIGIIFHSDVDDETNRVQTEITLDTDRYYVLTNDGLTEVEMGVRIIVKDESGWPGTIFAHIWDDDDNATEWPGIKATGGYFDSDSYLVFLTPKVFKGKTVNVIFHSDDDADNNRFQTKITLDQDRFYVLSKEFKFNEQEKKPVTIYVEDKTGWDEMALYLFGEVNNLGGAWPGNQVARTEEILGVTFKVFEIPDAFGRKEVLIFNNNGHDIQLNNYPDDNGMLFDKEEYFFVVTADGVTASERPSKDPNARATRVYVNNETGWADLYLYVWGDSQIFGDWAGAKPNGEVTFAGVPYSYFDVSEDDWGKKANFIFNNNAGTQLENFDDLKDQTINKDFFFHLTADAASQVATPSSRIYVQDNTGWANLYVYSWGTGELFGGWPGKAITETTTIGDVTYKYVDVPADKWGWAANLIFNNNDGTQLENFDVLKEQKIGCDFYFKLTSDNVTVIE